MATRVPNTPVLSKTEAELQGYSRMDLVYSSWRMCSFLRLNHCRVICKGGKGRTEGTNDWLIILLCFTSPTMTLGRVLSQIAVFPDHFCLLICSWSASDFQRTQWNALNMYQDHYSHIPDGWLTAAVAGMVIDSWYKLPSIKNREFNKETYQIFSNTQERKYLSYDQNFVRYNIQTASMAA